jgi:hypothetical protein
MGLALLKRFLVDFLKTKSTILFVLFTQVLLLHIYIFRTCLFTIYDKLYAVNWLHITSIPYYKTFLGYYLLWLVCLVLTC